jgi:hypothetical protein
MTLKLTLSDAKEEAIFLNSSSTTPVIDLVKRAKTNAKKNTSKVGMKDLTVDIFCAFQAPTRANDSAEPKQKKVVYGRMQSGGTINCIGYVYARDDASSIVKALKSDLARSIKSRVNVYTEAALQQKEERENGSDGDDSDSDDDGSEDLVHPLVEAQRDGVQGLNTPITVCLPSRKLFMKDTEASGLDFELVYSHYVLVEQEVEEEEEASMRESQMHLEELLARKGFIPFDVEFKEKDRSNAIEGKAGFWDPTGRSKPKPPPAAATASSGKTKVNLSNLKASVQRSQQGGKREGSSEGAAALPRNLQIGAALFFVFIALALYQLKYSFQAVTKALE